MLHMKSTRLSTFNNMEKKNEQVIVHMVLARDFSEAGKFYNPTTYSYLRKLFNTETKRTNNNDVVQSFTTFLGLHLAGILQKPKDTIVDQNKIEVFEEKLKNPRRIKMNPIKNLVLKECNVSPMENALVKSYSPNFAVVQQPDKFIIFVEAPGLDQTNLENCEIDVINRYLVQSDYCESYQIIWHRRFKNGGGW